MAAALAKRRMSRTRDGQIETEQALDSVPFTRKRSRPLTDADNEREDDHEEPQRCKRPKVKSQEVQSLEVQQTVLPPRRRSLRLLRELRDQLSSGKERVRGEPSTTRHRLRQGAQPQKKTFDHQQDVERQDHSKRFNPQGKLVNSAVVRRGKHLRSSVVGIGLHRSSKRQRRQSASGLSVEQAEIIQRWLDESYQAHEPSITGKVVKAAENMPRKSSVVLPSPEDSFDRTTTSSRKSDRTSVSVHDSDYRQSLRHRNINIEREDAPTELIRRAHRIISRSRASPEMDDITVTELRRKSRQLQEDAEEEIVQLLGPIIIPAMKVLPDKKLARNADQPWNNSVPVPLDPDVLIRPLPLPKPKPDLTFGYSSDAFNHKQLKTIDLLVDEQFGRSFAVPDQKIRFPFLCVEFKAQAKGGTHYIATNQAAGAGAIALRGVMDLTDRSFGMKSFDYEEPQFFSVTMDHELARINVHWLKAPVDGNVPSFHVNGLSKHLLDDDGGIRAIIREIKNILDEGTDKRLRTLCEALDEYRSIVVRNREAADPRKIRHEAPIKVQNRPGDGDRQLAQETNAKRTRHGPLPKKASADELATNQRNVKQVTNEPRSTRHYAGKNAYQTAPKLDMLSRHTIAGAGESKRQIKPSQKLLESGRLMSKLRGRHDP